MASVSAEPRPVLPDGCYSGVDAGLGARAKLAALAENCIAGMAPVLPQPSIFDLPEGAKREVAFTVTDPAKCLRVVAAGGRGVTELELAIVDSRDRSFGEDELAGSFSLVGPRGPICVKLAGSYRAVLRARRGAGWVAIQIWRAK